MKTRTEPTLVLSEEENRNLLAAIAAGRAYLIPRACSITRMVGKAVTFKKVEEAR